MTTLDNILELLKINEMEQKYFAKQIGVEESTVAQWITDENKSYLEYLDAISNCFLIPVNCIKQEIEFQNSNEEKHSKLVHCEICGLTYCQIEEDIDKHKKAHKDYLKAIELFDFCWHYPKREKIKHYSWKVICDAEATIEKKQLAILNIVRCYFSRSVESYLSTTNTHPNFKDYFAMLLHADSLTGVKENIPTEKYNELIEKYGSKEGIERGCSYYIGSSEN